MQYLQPAAFRNRSARSMAILCTSIIYLSGANDAQLSVQAEHQRLHQFGLLTVQAVGACLT
jgi:hypothetical protein